VVSIEPLGLRIHSPMFFKYMYLKRYSHVLNRKKPVSAFGAKKGASVFRGLTGTELVLTCVLPLKG
jgi:hypothetical protein